MTLQTLVRGTWGWPLAALVLMAFVESRVARADDQPKKVQGVWTDAADPSLPPDFQVQGEYVGQTEDGQKLAAQVIALGNGAFQAVVYPGGLPGAGWDGENRILLVGKGDGEKTALEPASGERRYLAGPPEQFSAASTFPPQGHKPYSAVISGKQLTGKTDQGTSFTLNKTFRKSPTEGKLAPEGAIVLFDGTNTDEWTGGRLDAQNKILNTDGHDILSKRKFNNYVMHVEFLLPYRPDARGQGRGNSGFYQVDHYEVQILDSFGLEGKNNECGGIYTKADPLVNMCLPPLAWQTYDVEFTNAVVDENGNKLKNAVITLRHNGVLIHDKREIDGKTGGSRNDPEGTPGAIKLQGHGNPLQYRNIWVVEKP
jgi:hypothetical protein